ncbi:TRAP transporter large permease [Luteithermobacter gelatinilyticus]|uniref:TRAP transporter large permease n=1 Tax=Luteithermobacter gelatinilyticus TaxID=2582913 RepID=UPI00110692A8|nr:TRAP transporter large permease subunit [Luteithermobacter gelatinilyticus]
MELNALLDLLMFVSACLLLLSGFPVAFALGGTALVFAAIGISFGEFDADFIALIPERIYGIMTNDTLLAVPLFVFMGVMLERSRLAEELLESMALLMNRVRGGLGISVTIVGALLAASTGIVGATVVTMGLLSLPTMLKRGYSPAHAGGAIAAAGTLGQIIPPSIVLILLGDQLSSAWQSAQLEMGNWSPEPLSVGDLFAGALLPGLGLVLLYIAYQTALAILKPDSVPLHQAATDGTSPTGDIQNVPLSRIMGAFLPPILLIIAVLGSILAGIATPTEAAAVGAVGATLMAGHRAGSQDTRAVYAAGIGLAGLLLLNQFFDLRLDQEDAGPVDKIAVLSASLFCGLIIWGIVVSLLRLQGQKVLQEVMQNTTRISSMIFVILIGAALFSLVFKGFEGDEYIHEFLSDLPGGKLSALILVMLVMFVLGFFLDFIEITFVVVPIVAPVLLMMDINPVWLGVMMAMNLQTSFLTPPFGFALFYLRGVAPESVKTSDIYRGVIPYVIIQIFALILLWFWPELTTWLPEVIFRSAS